MILGTVSTLSGPVGGLFKDGVTAVQVWIKYKNDTGGINGHHLVYIVADDGADPARHRALLQQLVERQKVQAFLFMVDGVSTSAAATQYLEQARVPVVGTEGGSGHVYDSAMFFPNGSAGDETAVGAIRALHDFAIPRGQVKLGTMVCAEVPHVCGEYDRVFHSDRVTKNTRFEYVYRGRASLTQPDYTAECLAAARAGVQVFLTVFESLSVARIANSCARQGFRPLFGLVGDGQVASHLRDNGNLEGALLSTRLAAWPARDLPAMKELYQALARYDSHHEVTAFSVNGWVAAKIFEHATKDLVAPTSKAILEGLWSVKDFDAGGLTYPLTYAREKPTPPRACWSFTVLHNHQYQVPTGGRMQCETDR